jgi:hypothetical protein
MDINLNIVNWIMGYVGLTSFVVLINGSLSSLFNSSRGLRQGCPMSPFFIFNHC